MPGFLFLRESLGVSCQLKTTMLECIVATRHGNFFSRPVRPVPSKFVPRLATQESYD